MIKVDLEKMENHQRFGWNVNLSDNFNKAFQVLQKELVLFGLYTFLLFIIIIVSLFGIIIPLFIALPLTMGFAIACEKVDAGNYLNLSDFFQGFNNILNAFLYTIVLIIVQNLVYLSIVILIFSAVALKDVNFGNSEFFGMFFTGTFLISFPILFILSIVLGIFMFFAPYLIIFGNQSQTLSDW